MEKVIIYQFNPLRITSIYSSKPLNSPLQQGSGLSLICLAERYSMIYACICISCALPIIALSDNVDKALSLGDPHMKKKGFLVYSLRDVILFVVFDLD